MYLYPITTEAKAEISFKVGFTLLELSRIDIWSGPYYLGSFISCLVELSQVQFLLSFFYCKICTLNKTAKRNATLSCGWKKGYS